MTPDEVRKWGCIDKMCREAIETNDPRHFRNREPEPPTGYCPARARLGRIMSTPPGYFAPDARRK